MNMDDLSAEELKAVALQDVAATVSDLGALVQIVGESDMAESVITLILTKKEGSGPQLLETHFVGNPVHLERMMKEGTDVIKRLSRDGIQCIQLAEEEIEPWDVV